MALWNVLRSQTNVTINNVHIPYIKLLNSEPIDVGTDEKGVYERVIEIDFYYSKEYNMSAENSGVFPVYKMRLRWELQRHL